MIADPPRSVPLTGCLMTLAMAVLSIPALAAQPERSQHPITKLARIIDPQLAKVEDRVNWLDRQMVTLSHYAQFPLKHGLGYRGCRRSEHAPDPTITMDLGKEHQLTEIYLIPTQQEYLNDTGIFPQRFTIECSNSPDFDNPNLVYRTGESPHQQNGGYPMKLKTKYTAQYIRISIQEGHEKGATDLFGFSEIVVLSDTEPVSFNASITTTGSLNIEGMWYPEALIDGRMPLGLWHNGKRPLSQLGDAVLVHSDTDTTGWKVTLPEECHIDRVVLFPYLVNRSYEASMLPEFIKIKVKQHPDDEAFQTVYEWSNPVPGINQMTPLVIPLHGVTAKTVLIHASKPWKMGTRRIHALSEIEIWSEGTNQIAGRPVTRIHDDEEITVTTLTDGFSSEKTIASIGSWLNQLRVRGKIQQELDSLRHVYRQLASRSELNVSWGSAVVLGLTFLIPVYIVERRRMQSREHLDIIRKRIASDLHDDIGSNLGSISLIARTARKDLARLQGPSEIDDDLGEVETIARESSLAMRDIVWLLERKQDSIGDLVHRMRETAGRLLRETQFALDCTSTKTAAKLTLDAKRHLFLFYKEAIHNIIKHSQANRVSIRLWDEGEKLGMEIQDDGIGLPVTKDRVSITIKKLEDRAHVLGGILQFTSSADTGTCVRLLVKRSHLTAQPKNS